MRRLLGALTLAGLALAACKNTTSLAGTGAGGAGGGTGGAGGSGGGGSLPKVGKVDVLFGIDNSRSMADKQQILSLALSDLISGLANPPCLDPGGNYVSQPGSLVECPEGSARQYQPVLDIHVGVITSSLGGHGSDACAADTPGKESNDDHAHLITRKDPTSGEEVPTYQDVGYLAWDPAQALDPPGEGDEAALVQNFQDLVVGAGQIGCGYEAQLESLYRFLVQPDPPQTVALNNEGTVEWQGTDEVLLAQRTAFLRPDSMLVIVAMSDENDCSIREEGQFYYAAQQKSPGGAVFHMPRPRSICQSDPKNVCCLSCGQAPPKDDQGNPLCPDDPICKDQDGSLATLDEETDNINLRCFDQKRRFGIDFLYPVSRYVDGFTSPTVTDRNGQVVPNPVFSDLSSSDGIQSVRDPGLVLFAGILGVPWQDIAKNWLDLKQGFKTAGELTQPNVNGHTVWDIILGDPDNYVPPLDPFMRESSFPRSGVNPVTGDATTLAGFSNPINGHEFPNPMQDELQYACIMPIPEPRDCSSTEEMCDCLNAESESPLCEPNPNDAGNKTLQVAAKAMPGLRQLSVLRGLGDRAVIGSVCAGQLDAPDLPDYAYRPVVASLLDRMKLRLE